MLSIPTGLKVYLALKPVDMRKHFNGLWTEVQQALKMDPREGSIYVFGNKSRDRLKLLYWDGTGVCILSKRLEKGRFSWPKGTSETRLTLTPEALTMLLAGIDLRDGMRRAWYETPQ